MTNKGENTYIEKNHTDAGVTSYKQNARKSPNWMLMTVMTLALTAALVAASPREALAADYTIGSAWFDDYNGHIVARWDETVSKTKYRVQLYKGDAFFADGSPINANKVGDIIKTSGESHDMTRLIIDEGAGTYRFTVYPIEEPSLIIQSDTIQITYERLEGTSEVTGWQKTGDEWYYYADDGTLRYGWQCIDGVWYYLAAKGNCLMDTYTPDGYYVDATGAWDGKPKL